MSDLDKLNEYEAKDKIKGYVFDSKTPGSGKTFDWSLLDNIRQRQKTDASKDVSHKKNKKMIFLAGGIDETNVKRAISQVVAVRQRESLFLIKMDTFRSMDR